MERIRRRTVTDHLGQDLRPACLCMLHLFQYQYARSFAHHETAPSCIKGQRAGLGILTCTECRQCREARYTDRTDRRLRTAGNHHIRIPVLDGTERFADRMGTGCARRYYINILSLQTISDADITGSHIGDHQRDPERAHLGRPLLQQTHIVSLDGLQAADAAAHGTAHAERIFFFHIHSRIFDRFPGCRYRKLGETLHTLRRFLIDRLQRIIVLHLCGDLHLVIRRIKSRDRRKPDLPFFDPCPETLHIISDGGDCSQSGDHYTSAFHIAIPPSTHSTCPVI